MYRCVYMYVYTYTHTYIVFIKNTNEHSDKEVNRARSGRVIEASQVQSLCSFGDEMLGI